MSVIEYIIGAVLVVGVLGFIGWKVYQKYKANAEAFDKLMKFMEDDGKGAP